MRRFLIFPALLATLSFGSVCYAAENATTTAERDVVAPGAPTTEAPSIDVERGISAPKADGGPRSVRDAKPNGMARMDPRKL